MAVKSKPRVFVGSSVESLDVAYATQENLEFDCEVTVWTQGIFDLSKTAVESLLKALGDFDFAIFVFAPNDVVKIRQQSHNAVRDNVVYELGLFTGRLGKDRTFIISPRGHAELHFPTDLLGIIPGSYEAKRQDKNLIAALGPACTKLKRSFNKVGSIKKKKPVRRTLSPPLAAGLSAELREEMLGLFTEQAAKIEKALQTFEQRLSPFEEAKQRSSSSSDSQISTLIQVVRQLSDEARALLKALNSNHLTYEEYQILKASPISNLLIELRNAGLLVPLAGRPAGPSSPRSIVVYWFPPEIADNLRQISEGLPNAKSKIANKINAALAQAHYPN